MPAMLRPKKSKATKIAHAILGKPAVMTSKPTKKQIEIDRRLAAKDTTYYQ